MTRTLAKIAILALALSGSTALASADAATSHHPSRTAKAGAYQVRVDVNKTEPVIGDRIKIKGSVKPAAPRADVRLQVKYEGQKRWKTIDTKALSRASTYKFKQKINTERDRRYRVLKPAGPHRGAGHSQPVTVTVFAWRALSSFDPPGNIAFFYGVPATINGVAYPSSLVADNTGAAQGHYVAFNLDRACKTFEAVAGLDDRSASAGSATVAVDTDGAPRYSGSFALTQSEPVVLDITGVFRISFTASTANSGDAVVGSPRVLCNF